MLCHVCAEQELFADLVERRADCEIDDGQTEVEQDHLAARKVSAGSDAFSQWPDAERIEPADHQECDQEQRFGVPVELHGFGVCVGIRSYGSMAKYSWIE